MSDDAYDRLQQAAERVANRVQYEQGNRRGLLWTHAMMGMLAGLQMIVWGGPGTVEDLLGVEIRPYLALLGIVGGLLLMIGLTSRPRSIPLELAGLFFVGAWDLAMTVGLMAARIEQHNYAPLPIDEAVPAGYVVSYPVTIYAGLFVLICIHLVTLRKIKRARMRL